MPKLLIAVCTCHPNRAKAQAQRETWAQDVEGMDVRFFYGGGEAQNPDEVILDCPDNYGALPEKVRQMFAWAVDHGYDYVMRCDDDVMIAPDRLLKAVPYGFDYCGRLRGPSGSWRASYASGFAYWLSAKAAKVRVAAKDHKDDAEDRATGNILHAAGISCHPDYRYVVATSNKNATSGQEGPRVGNDIIVSCEYSPESLRQVYWEWKNLPSLGKRKMMPTGTPFDRVCILLKTFLRDPMLMKAISGIEQNLPGAKMVIMDDGRDQRQKISEYSRLREIGHVAAWLPFDSGFGAKSNAAIKYYDREYVLVGSDDFDFTPEVAEGVKKLIKLLDARPDIGVASGRVDNGAYEGFVHEALRPDGLKDVKITPLPEKRICEKIEDVEFMLCDHTVNYNLVRKEVFKSVKWDEKFKIGGDHFDFYAQAKKAGWNIAWVKGVNIKQQRYAGPSDPYYDFCRGRARLALPWCFERNKWNSFTALDGRVDTRESVQKWVDNYKKEEPERIDLHNTRRAAREQRIAKRRAIQAKKFPPR